jgi:hypothetical protein
VIILPSWKGGGRRGGGGGLAATLYKKREQQQVPFQFQQIESMFLFFYNNVIYRQVCLSTNIVLNCLFAIEYFKTKAENNVLTLKLM